MFEEGIRKLLKVNMNLKEDERLLLLTDTEKDYLVELMDSFVDVARSLTKYVEHFIYPSLKGHGKEPPEEVWELTFGKRAIEELKLRGLMDKILGKEAYSEEEVAELLKKYAENVPDVAVVFSYYSTTHTFYRKALTDLFGCRYASMPLFEVEMFYGPMDVDWHTVASMSRDLADILTEAEWAHVKAEGTDIEFSLQNRLGIADTGLLHERGQYGNLPAGEAFVAPVEGTAHGFMTILYGPDRPLEQPIKLYFRDGAVERLEGVEPYRFYLEDVFKTYNNARFLAELGVGTNPKAKRPDNVLEAEKILGTVHLAIGDNHTFGGLNKVPFHTDYVVFEPTLVVGGRGWQKILLEKGKLRI